MAKTKLEWKTIKLEDMMDYIEKNCPNDKEWFKSVAIVKGKYEHFIARKEFAEKYMPEIIPVKKPKKPIKSDKLLNW